MGKNEKMVVESGTNTEIKMQTYDSLLKNKNTADCNDGPGQFEELEDNRKRIMSEMKVAMQQEVNNLNHDVTVRLSVVLNIQKGPRPGADLVGRAAVKFNSPSNGEGPTNMELSLDILHGARRRLMNCQDITLVIVGTNALLLVTTKFQEMLQAQNGLAQCKGCGGFFSLTRGKGLWTHQTTSQLLACSEAGLDREKIEGYYINENDEFINDVQSSHESSSKEEGGTVSVVCHKNLPSWRASAVTAAVPLIKEVKSSENGLLDRGLVASRDGDLEELKRLVTREHWDVNTKDRHGSSALLWAAGGGHLQICMWLVEKCSVDPRTSKRKDGRCALHWAARNGMFEICRWLIETCEVPPDCATCDGDTSFMFAAWQGHIDICRYFVDRWKVNINNINRWGCNALFKAARMDGMASDIHMLRYLLEIGVNTDVVNVGGHSLFHKAAIYGNEDVIEILIQHPTCCVREHFLQDRTNQRPSDIAAYNGFPALSARLRHVEDCLWWVPVVYCPTPLQNGTKQLITQ